MNFFDTAAVLATFAAVFAYLNHRTLRLPFAIGLMTAGLAASLLILLFDYAWPGFRLGADVKGLVSQIDFSESLLHGMLSFLLFAGALHVDLESLLRHRGPILVLATIGVCISALLFGTASFFVLQWMGLPLSFPVCLVFGALFAPTDPVAVLGILKSCGVSEALETKIAGESLFNDGIGVILFTALLGFAFPSGSHGTGISAILLLFLLEVGGGILLGLLGGYIVFRAMRSVNEPNLEVLMSFALVMALSFASFQLHFSAPLACVIAGLFIGNHGRKYALEDESRKALDVIWSFIDEALNAVLFLLIGLEILAFPTSLSLFLSACILIPLALASRWISVSIPIWSFSKLRDFTKGTISIMTWGGIKGGISVALVLSIPSFEGKEILLGITYILVIFSILVQGLTMNRFVRWVQKDL